MLADRVHRIDASGIRKVFDLAATMENPINLSIGQPDFDVPEPAKDAAIEAIRDGFNRYTPTQGIPEMHERIRSSLQETRGFEPEATLVTSGVSGGLLLSLLATINAGDEVIYMLKNKMAVRVVTTPDLEADAANANRQHFELCEGEAFLIPEGFVHQYLNLTDQEAVFFFGIGPDF